MPPTRLPERPKPPSGSQMLEDISGASDNDVVFMKGQAMDLSDLTPTMPDGVMEGGDTALTQATLTRAESREAAQRAYHRAQELIMRVQGLEEAPEMLVEQFSKLDILSQDMVKAIKDLQDSSVQVTAVKDLQDSSVQVTAVKDLQDSSIQVTAVKDLQDRSIQATADKKDAKERKSAAKLNKKKR